MCGSPSAPIVVTMASRIIGIGSSSDRFALSVRPASASRVRSSTGRSVAQPQSRGSSCDVALAETESDFRLHEFRSEIEGVGSIGLDPEFVEQREGSSDT